MGPVVRRGCVDYGVDVFRGDVGEVGRRVFDGARDRDDLIGTEEAGLAERAVEAVDYY